jgi:pyruvate dehydrogenase E2 component (dihydrolipoamide acetyltransferase)
MPIPVIMPKVDMDQEIATIISWEKNGGDQVKQDETILTVETEKVSIDVTSPASGTLVDIKYQAGDVVPVATVIAQILKPGETLTTDPGMVSPLPDQASAVEKPTEKTEATKIVSETSEVQKEASSTIVMTAQEAVVTSETGAGKVAATPAARRIAEESGISLDSIQGSGPVGRIQAADVKQVEKSPQTFTDRQAEVIPLVDMRAKIAKRMQASFQDAPHIAETIEADVSRLEDTRAYLNEIASQKGEGKVSFTGIMVKLVAWAFERNPYINSSLIDEKIYLWKEINIGVATALENGLIVPVVRNANQLSFSQTAEQLNDLSLRARQGRLELNEVQRGTFTISNLGMYGITQFRAIINPPESAILAVGATVRKPIVIDHRDTIAVRPMICLTLSADHRVIDGVVAAKFLADLVKVMEHPEILLG